MKDRPVLRWMLGAAYAGALAGAAIGALLMRMQESEYANWGEPVASLARFVRQHPWIVALMPGVAAVARWGSEHLTRSWLLKMVQSLLTDYCDQVFSGQAGAKDDHRATLFVRRQFALKGTFPWSRHRHPFSGWLVPVARSGHTTQNVRARFLAPDRAEKSEGVAGMTWRNRAIVTTPALPKLTSTSVEADIEAYCKLTKITEAWVRKRLEDDEELPLSLRGLPVEVANELWGVVVLDSKDPNAFAADPTGTRPETQVFSSTIGRLLERARI